MPVAVGGAGRISERRPGLTKKLDTRIIYHKYYITYIIDSFLIVTFVAMASNPIAMASI